LPKWLYLIGFPSDFWWYTQSNKETEATVLENSTFVDAVRMHDRAQRTEASRAGIPEPVAGLRRRQCEKVTIRLFFLTTLASKYG